MKKTLMGVAVLAAAAIASFGTPSKAEAYYGGYYRHHAPVVYPAYRSYYYSAPVVYSPPVYYSAPVVYSPVVYSRPVYYSRPYYYGPRFSFGYYGGHHHHRHHGHHGGVSVRVGY